MTTMHEKPEEVLGVFGRRKPVEQPFLSPYLCVHMAGMAIQFFLKTFVYGLESGSPYTKKDTFTIFPISVKYVLIKKLPLQKNFKQ